MYLLVVFPGFKTYKVNDYKSQRRRCYSLDIPENNI
jgi:hypothetical protein